MAGEITELTMLEAARKGDVTFLKEAVAALHPPEYFLTQERSGNMLHIAVAEQNVEFLQEAMNILSPDILKQLLVQTTIAIKKTVLHLAAEKSNITVVKCIKEMYASLSWDDGNLVKPWLALTEDELTPLNMVLKNSSSDEKCVMEIMSMDPELESWTIADKDGNTPLYYALNNGFNLVAENILMSPQPAICILGTNSFLDLLRIATKCSGNVVRVLFEKCDGRLFNDGNTTLHSALQSSTQELALEILATYPAMREIRNNKGESPFFLAVWFGCEEVVGKIMSIEEPRFHMLRRNDGTTVLHKLSSCPEKLGQILLRKFWWMINLRDNQGNTALDYAKKEKAQPWLVNWLTDPSVIEKQDFDWIEACKREEIEAVQAFVDNCQDLHRVCRRKNDTPLHHIKLASYKDYLNFLNIPSIAELKNTTDHDGATPLHRALERKDVYFAKALLLDDEVQHTIRDSNGRTAMDLLAKLCKENDEWDKMCELIKVNPDLKTTYIHAGTNLDQMRNTLSVIAALLATITFAAAFTLPGGLNSNNGEALLGKKLTFIGFLLADAYAMCTSMLVLFCLVWSMVSQPSMARLLVDRSVFILLQSLYATLLAFLFGIFTVMVHSSLWAVAVISFMCFTIGLAASPTILHNVISKLVPAANRERQDQMRLLEEGHAWKCW